MSDPPLRFVIKTSRIALSLLSMLHALALYAAWANTLPVSVKVAVSLLIMLHFSVQWRHYGVHSHSTMLGYSDTLGWYRIINDATVPIQIMPSSIITPFLIIVHYQQRPEHSSMSTIVCFKDALTQSVFRQLFVQLKIAGLEINKGNR
jgi:hypothetical protein